MEKDFQNRFNDFLIQGIDRYEFLNTADIIKTIPALRGLGRFEEAIELYQKYETDLQDTDVYSVALSNIIIVCNECNNITLLIKYAQQLKAIYPDHPFVLNVAKHHNI